MKKIEEIMTNLALTIEPYDKWGIINKLRDKKLSQYVFQENQKTESAPARVMNWPKDVNKPLVGLVRPVKKDPNTYWDKFERFLKENHIPYDFIQINKSTFIEQVEKLDIVVWRTPSLYFERWEAGDKVDFIEKHLRKMILPPSDALWLYEDKVRAHWFLEQKGLPVIKTFISHSKDETRQYLESCQYPLVSKERTCSGSEGVTLLKNKRQAMGFWRKVFFKGLKLKNTYVKQKDYVYLQELVPNKGFDLRVIIVGNSYFGYYRMPKKGDYRASGSGIVDKKEIPVEVLSLAKRVWDSYPKTYLLAVDFLQDSRDNQYYIIETSIFIGVETCEQLVVDGVPGRYVETDGDFVFEPGRFWVQELMLEEMMKDWIEQERRR